MPKLLKAVEQKITTLFTELYCLVEILAAEMISFGNKNKFQSSGYDNQQKKYYENKFQNDLCKSQQYCNFEDKFKAIPNILK